MTLASEILARRMRLPRTQTRDVVCEPDLPAVMEDGTVLLADRWVARGAAARAQATVLVRSPYGRRGIFGLLFGRLLAERGLQVVIQSVRGTFGSGGTFDPFDERADGLATLRWLREQPWHDGRVGMIGPSYLGLVQWALAPEAGSELTAMAVQVSASQFHGQTYAGGSLSLETAASWLVLVAAQERRFAPLAIIRALRRLPELLSVLPLSDLDERATGAQVPWFREAVASPRREDAFWVRRDFAAGVERVVAPVQFVGGWYDIFLPWMLQDFSALDAAGRTVQLIIGPWTHTAPGSIAVGLREGLAWLRAHLLDDRRLVRPAKVRVRLTGQRTDRMWREFDSWPPAGTREHRLWLGDGGGLQEQDPAAATAAAAAAGGADRYRYDPRDPTPSIGGPVLLAREPVLDNRSLEARSDVLTYTSPPLPSVLESIGWVSVELYIRSSSPHFDIFARVCDVDLGGASWNVCDALVRADPARFRQRPDGVWRIAFELWPIGHRFAPGHRVRLQVASGAHPRYARNTGTGEDPVTTSRLQPVDIEVLRGPRHPSMVSLPLR